MIKIKIRIIIFFNILYIRYLFEDSNVPDKTLLTIYLDGNDTFLLHQVLAYKLGGYLICNNHNKILYIQDTQTFYESPVKPFSLILYLSNQTHYLCSSFVELSDIFMVDIC